MMKVKEQADNSNTEMDSSPLDMKQLCFNNLQLLGFDAPAMEAANHIPFNKMMFELPNKRGAEIVLHFLFQRLNPTMCREAFRDCWPILDKKREQGFRKTCSNWLTNMAQEADSHLPRINASLFMSPGGEKFYQLLFHFSGYVLQKVLDTDLATKCSERLKYPTLTQQNIQLGEVIMKEFTCSSIRHRNGYFDTAQLTLKANKAWKEAADEDVREYRKLNKEVRDLDYKVREEEQRNVEASLARGSPVKKRGQTDHFDSDFDSRTIKRAQRIQQVRDMWKQVEDFDRTESAEREVIESIVERTINKYRLDAADISVKVPDMLLRECGEEIRRRNVDNTYQGGKLNVVSVLQLWNLCLHLYLEKLHQVGVPKFDQEVKKMTSQVHVQQSYKQNAQTLRQQMSERIPVMKSSIEKLREKLDGVFFKDQSPDSIRTTSVGLGLVGPSPQPSFSPGDAVTPAGGIGIPRSQDDLETPDAASKITQNVISTVRQGPRQLFGDQGNLDMLAHDKRKEQTTFIPKPSKAGSEVSSRHSSRPTSARSTTSTKGSKSSVKSTPRSAASRQKQAEYRDEDFVFTKVTSPRTMVESLKLTSSQNDGQDANNNASFHGTERLNMSGTSQPLSARSDRSDRSSLCKTLSARSDISATSPKSFKSGSSVTLSARSEKSASSPRSVKSGFSGNLSPRSETAAASPRSLKSELSGNLSVRSVKSGSSKSLSARSQGDYGDLDTRQRPGRKTPTDYLVEEIMGEGEILSPFNSGLEAFVSREIVNRTPELDEASVVNHTQELEAGVVNRTPGFYEAEVVNRTPGLYEAGVVNRTPGLYEAGMVNKDNVTSANTIVIETPDGGGDLQTESPYDLQTDTGEDDGEEFEEILGPELDEEYDNDTFMSEGSQGSQRSQENVIVIDKSLHQSPKIYSDRRSPIEFRSESPEMLIDDEQFPSLENSPQQAIVIDKSYQRSPGQHDSPKQARNAHTNQSNNANTEIQFMSPGSKLSMSYQGAPASVEGTPTAKALLSRSLLQDRSPLSDEIRRMFKEAIADTPPSNTQRGMGQTFLGTPPPTTNLTSYPSELEMPNMDINSREDGSNGNLDCDSPEDASGKLEEGDISWDMTENLDDIQMPDIDLVKGYDNEFDEEITFKKTDDEILQHIEGEGIQDVLIPDFGNDDDDNDIDDFFKSKTPELPKRSYQATGGDVDKTPPMEEGTLQIERSLDDGSSMEMPKFPLSSLKNESPLISFTP